ncbi:MAG TPA: hypothetical protein VHR45_07465 [Thermoanaerobaculia bacterium]|nr:hypothetical protein [Thermoanaerobaculia bacterium]
MRNRQAGLLCLVMLFVLFACNPQPTPPPQQALETAKPKASGYPLKIYFHGLITFGQDSGKIWAFLVKANYQPDPPDPAKVTDGDLPPGMFQELQNVPLANRAVWLQNNVPPHFPYIRFKNAIVTGDFQGDPEKGRPIPKADLQFITSATGLSTPKLDLLASANLIHTARSSLSLPTLSTFDTFDRRLVSGSLDTYLAARASIKAGDVTANLVNRCGPISYSFKLASESGCPGVGENLAEEVEVDQQLQDKEKITIDLGTGEKLIVEPKDPTQTLVVEVVNQTQDLIDNPNAKWDCKVKQLHSHLPSFRWFYRLLNPASQAQTGQHYYPCHIIAPKGPPDCPDMLLY